MALCSFPSRHADRVNVSRSLCCRRFEQHKIMSFILVLMVLRIVVNLLRKSTPGKTFEKFSIFFAFNINFFNTEGKS